jgi:hypothetical protein
MKDENPNDPYEEEGHPEISIYMDLMKASDLLHPGDPARLWVKEAMATLNSHRLINSDELLTSLEAGLDLSKCVDRENVDTAWVAGYQVALKATRRIIKEMVEEE